MDWKEGNYSITDKPHPRGEVHVGGNTVGHGYYKMPEKTKEDFYVDENGIRWFKTGDIGMLDETGNLTLIGKMIVKFPRNFRDARKIPSQGLLWLNCGGSTSC